MVAHHEIDCFKAKKDKSKLGHINNFCINRPKILRIATVSDQSPYLSTLLRSSENIFLSV